MTMRKTTWTVKVCLHSPIVLQSGKTHLYFGKNEIISQSNPSHQRYFVESFDKSFINKLIDTRIANFIERILIFINTGTVL